MMEYHATLVDGTYVAVCFDAEHAWASLVKSLSECKDAQEAEMALSQFRTDLIGSFAMECYND